MKNARSIGLGFALLLAACNGSGVTAPSDAAVANECPTDPAAAVGTACTIANKTCGECANQCQFCNLISCVGERWQNEEVFPVPCDGGT